MWARTLWTATCQLGATYDLINRMFYKLGWIDRITGLVSVMRRLQELVRKRAGRSDIETALARCVSHLVAIVSELELSKDPHQPEQSAFLKCLIAKWGLPDCFACHEEECSCGDEWHERLIEWAIPFQFRDRLTWSIRQWQQAIRAKYHENNLRETDPKRMVLLRSHSEAVEIVDAWRQIGTDVMVTPQDIQRLYAEEAGDLFAWFCSTATVLTVDLEDAVKRRYPEGKCHACGKSPCRCPYYRARGIKPLRGYVPEL